MESIFKQIYNWIEVWSIVIPLLVLVIKKPKEKYLNIVVIYLIITLSINLLSDISWLYKKNMPLFLQDNNFLYNINSICRLFFFMLFFKNVIRFDISKSKFDYFLIAYIILCVLYFSFISNFFKLNSYLHTFESVSLLTVCIIYFIKLIKSDEIFLSFDPYLIIVAGLSIYESVNFFLFLFFDYLMDNDRIFAASLWKVHNAVFLVFCIFIARAFYGRLRYHYT